MSMEHIESEIKWSDTVTLPSGKTYREKYRLGYGGNNFNYRIYKRGGKWEAHVSYMSGFAQKNMDNLPLSDSFHTSRTLKEMNEWLGNLKPIKAAK